MSANGLQLKEIGGIVLRRKICVKRKILLRKGISVKYRQLLLGANRYRQV